MDQKTLSRADCDLMVGLCQYYAQILYERRHKLDPEKSSKPFTPLVGNVVPAGTKLHDGVVKVYRRAAFHLVMCGFAEEIDLNGGQYTLLMASDQFTLAHPVTSQSPSFSDLGGMLRSMFDIHDDYEILGPPASLRRIFDLLLAAGFTEMRHGHLEWSEKACTIDCSRPLSVVKNPVTEIFWNTDLFDWHAEEAAKQWP